MGEGDANDREGRRKVERKGEGGKEKKSKIGGKMKGREINI